VQSKFPTQALKLWQCDILCVLPHFHSACTEQLHSYRLSTHSIRQQQTTRHGFFLSREIAASIFIICRCAYFQHTCDGVNFSPISNL